MASRSKAEEQAESAQQRVLAEEEAANWEKENAPNIPNYVKSLDDMQAAVAAEKHATYIQRETERDEWMRELIKVVNHSMYCQSNVQSHFVFM